MGGGAGRLRRLAARARHGREDAPRLRRRPRPARRVGRRPRTRPEGAVAPRAAPLRRRARRARRRQVDGRPASWPRSAPSTATWSSAASSRAIPADLVSSPKKDAYLPQVLKPAEVAELLERIPGVDAARPARPRHVRARLRGRPARRGADAARRVASADPDAEQVRVEGKGGRTRFVPVGRARLARARPLPRPRPARARLAARARRCSSRRAAGGCPPRTCGAG